MKRRHALSSLVVIFVLKSCQSKGVLSGYAYEIMTRSRPETKTEQMLPASSGLFSPAGGTSQMPCPVRKPSGNPVSNRCNFVPPIMLTTTAWDFSLLRGLPIEAPGSTAA